MQQSRNRHRRRLCTASRVTVPPLASKYHEDEQRHVVETSCAVEVKFRGSSNLLGGDSGGECVLDLNPTARVPASAVAARDCLSRRRVDYNACVRRGGECHGRGRCGHDGGQTSEQARPRHHVVVCRGGIPRCVRGDVNKIGAEQEGKVFLVPFPPSFQK